MQKKELLIVVLFMMLFASCSNNKFKGFEKGENSVWYKIHQKSGDTLKPHLNDYVTVKMRYYLKDTTLFDSKTLENKFEFPIIKPMFKGDIYDGMKLMAEGDSFTFAVVADSFFYNTAGLKKLPDYVKPGDPMYFDIKMEKILSPEQYRKAENMKLQKQRQSQLDLLNKYITDNNITTAPTRSGLYHIVLSKGKGRQPKPGEMCEVHLKVEAIGVEFTLYDNFESDPIFIEYGKPFDTEGLMEGLSLMKEGELAQLIVPSDIGVGKDGKEGAVPPYSTIVYKVKLNKIRSKEEVREIREKQAEKKAREDETLKKAEAGKISAYIEKHNITTKPTASGLYYIPGKEGSGAHPEKGDILSVHYTLYNTNDEKLFSTYDDGKPFDFILEDGVVVPGWVEALPMMKKGGTAKLIIPSKLGYKGVAKKAYNIPAYSPLIIDLELLDFKTKDK
jgi:FKBP-type peptidyl-prolyl cis-trans isomerase